MLKNKLKTFFILLTISLLMCMPLSFADDEIQADTNAEQSAPAEAEQKDTTATEAVPTTNEQTEQTTTNENQQIASAQDTMKKGDVYLTGKDITVDYIVDGNLYIMAENVTISSQIGGDAFILANNINITDKGYIYSNLFAASSSLNIDGVVYDVYSCADNVTISGYIYRDVRTGCNSLNIFGTVGRNVFASSKNFNFVKDTTDAENKEDSENSEETQKTKQGNIGGDLNYSSNKEITVPENVVSGNVNYSKVATENTNKNVVAEYVISLLTFIALVVIVRLLAQWLAPKFLANAKDVLATKPLPLLGYGFLSLILLPIIVVLSFVLQITSSFGFIVLFTYIALAILSTSIFLIALSNILCDKFKVTKKVLTYAVLVATSAVVWALGFIPFVGGIVGFICVLFGFGIITKCVLPNKSKKLEK